MGRKRASIASAALVACILSTLALSPTANADESSYLASLQKRGIYLPPAVALNLGNFYCNQLRQGRNYNAVYSDITDYVHSSLGGLGRGGTGHLMGAAWNNLCPEFATLAQNTELHYIPRAQRG